MSRELDAMIAKELRYEIEFRKSRYGDSYITPYKEWGHSCPTCGYDGLWGPNEVPRFSTDGNAMLELDREMWERGYQIDIALWKEWTVIYWHDRERISKAIANTEPLARALAAYKALSGIDWKE